MACKTMASNMNSVACAIEEVEQMIASCSPSEKLDRLHKELDMSFNEYCRFQELKSLASMNGQLTLDEAQTVYGYLGNTVEHFNKQSLAVKVTLTRVFERLLKNRLGV